MEQRRLVITVGTSLFSSASWRAEGSIAVLVPCYRDWLGEDFLGRPSRRRTRGWETAARIEEVLLDDPHRFDGVFEWHEDDPKRYPGELNTLIQLHGRESDAGESVADFLGRSYGSIELVCRTSLGDPARVAAEHLAYVFGEVLRHPSCRVVGVLRSDHLREKVRHFAEYLRALPDGDVDLLVTGGYKAFALLGGVMTADRAGWRLLYLHEEQQGELVIADRDERGGWRQRFEDRQTVTVGRPTPVGEVS